MRPLPVLAAALALAACHSGDEANNAAAAPPPPPRPTGPPPLTPRLNLPSQGNEAGDWLGPQAPVTPPQQAPYGNLLDQPVVNGATAR